jgi:ferredoxin
VNKVENTASKACYEAPGLKPFLAALMEKFRVAAPVRNEGKLDFAFISSPDEAALDDTPTFKSAKEFLFPQSEKVITFTQKSAELVEQSETIAVIGVRPCDLAAKKVMTAVFTGGKYKDPFFQARLDRTVFIGLGCEKMKPGCFCDERGLDYAYSEDCDIFINPLNGAYSLRAFTERGEKILAQLAGKAGLKPARCAQPQENPAQKELVSLPEDAGDNEVFDLKTWDTAAQACLGCGTCTFICPTCHCFAFRDIMQGSEVARYRQWDSCMFPSFTLHASGHNPRSTKKERYRQRTMHKYLYVPRNFGLVACTGCGRCIRSCPAGISIKEVVKQAAEELKEAKA